MEKQSIKELIIEGVKVTFNISKYSCEYDTHDMRLIDKIEKNEEFIKWRRFIFLKHDFESGLLDDEGIKNYKSLLYQLVKENIDNK